MDEMMFCYQCEQAANCTACTGKAGVCGKSAETADAQDKLTGALIGFATLLLDIGRPIQPPQALLLTEGLFTTITNVDFDPQTVAQLTDKVWKAKQEAFASASPAPAPVSDYDMQKLWQEPDPDRKSLCSFVLFGLRGMAAYSYHARVLGYTDGEIDLFFCTALRAIAQERDKDKLFQLVEDTGRMAYRVMAELDKANTGAFGDPEPVEVPLTIEKGPFIVISGHDLHDLKLLLEHPGQVFSPREIYRKVWKDAPFGSENTVAVHIRHLREKIEIDPAEPRYLKVVWGQGYKLEKGMRT